MKKLLCVLLAVMTVLALAACGDKTPQQNGGQQDQPAQSVDLKKAAEDAIASIGNEDIVLMPEEDTDSIEAQYPGLTAVETKQLVVYWPPVVEVTNGADAETVRGILQQRVDNAANDTAYPENAPAWKNNSAVTVNGNYVVMGVLPEGVTLPAAFKAEF